MPTTFQDLPAEIVLDILELLIAVEIMALGMCCHCLFNFVGTDFFQVSP